MLKSLIILVLATTQLLAGSGGHLFVCLRDDGSFCCVDLGPASCDCCHDSDERPDHSQTSGLDWAAESVMVPRGLGDGESGNPALGDPTSADRCAVAPSPCGCTHIPLALSEDRPPMAVRSSISAEWELSDGPSGAMAVRFTATDADPMSRLAPGNGPSAYSEFAVTLVGTVNMRC